MSATLLLSDQTRLVLTAAEVAQLLGRSVETIRRMNRRGILRSVPNCRTLMFTKQAIDDFLTGKR